MITRGSFSRYLSPVARWANIGLRLAGLAVLVVHFALTVIYVLPINPVKIALQPLVYATIGTYFSQNWSFFAPNPISNNNSFLVRPLSAVEMSHIEHERLPEDGWYDLTSPMWGHFQRNRFSAYERLSRPQSNAMRMYMGGGPDLIPWFEACRKGDADACQFYDAQLQVYRERATLLLVRIASSFAQEHLGRDADVAGVAIQIRTQSVVPWSQRFFGKPVVTSTDLGIYPIQKGMAPSGVYDRE